MNEIKRMQQLAGINEIKINNPKNKFTVTPKGKEAMEAFDEFRIASDKLDVGGMIYEIDEIFEQYPHLLTLQNLNMLSDTHGEGIIKINGVNDLDQVKKDYSEIFGDVEDLITYLKRYKKEGYITDINL